MSGRSVYCVAPYSLSPDDLKPVFQVMLEYTNQRGTAYCVTCISRKKQMSFWLLTNV